MSRSQELNQAKLKEIYGVNFPDNLFWLHEFIVEQRDCEDPLENHTEYFLDGEDRGDSEENIARNRQQIELYKKLKNRIEEFSIEHQLSRNEGRPIGLETNTGLDIVLNRNFGRDRSGAIEMLKLGRELWYWNGKDRSAEAFELMKRAYELLDRPELIRILEAHFRDRDRPGVDSIEC